MPEHIYACPTCKPTHELQYIPLEPDRTIEPDAQAYVRLVCSECGKWWVMHEDGSHLHVGEKVIPKEDR